MDVILLCMLFVCACIQLDGHVPPKGLIGWCTVLAAVTWAVSVVFSGFAFVARSWVNVIPDALLGVFGGATLGYALTWAIPMAKRQELREAVHLAATITGVIVGIYGIVMIATFASLAQLAENLVCLLRRSERRLGIFTWLFTGTLIWMVSAQPLTELLGTSFPWVAVALGLLVPLWALLAGLVELQYQFERPPA